MGEVKELLRLVEERLVQHDNNRRELQEKLESIHTRNLRDADLMEERFNREIREDFDKKEERILGLIERLNEGGGDDLESILNQAQKELSVEQLYEIESFPPGSTSVDSYKLRIVSVPVETKKEIASDNENKAEEVSKLLRDHLDKIHESMTAVQDEIAGTCTMRRKESEEMKSAINEKLGPAFGEEDARLQGFVKLLRDNIDNENSDEVDELEAKTKAALIETQRYGLCESLE